MRKVFLFMMISADGNFEGPGHDLSWHNVDEEFAGFAVQQLDEADTLIMGRKTYELMYNFWPSEHALQSDPDTASRMNSYRKIVFSRSMQESLWNNTEIYSEDPSKVITALQAQPGKDIAVLGSSNLCLTLIEERVLDEVRLMVNPVILGSGTPLFTGITRPLHLSLTTTRRFNSGNELLTYVPSY